MNKILSKAVMNRSRLRNKYLKYPNDINLLNYRKYRNYCTSLFRKEKRKFFSKLDTKLICDNKTFWKTVKPLFSDKHSGRTNITLIEDNEIISNDEKNANIFNNFFTNVVSKLDIKGFESNYTNDTNIDTISNIIEKFKTHPSIIKIRENVGKNDLFSFKFVDNEIIRKQIISLKRNKATTSDSIPTKLLVNFCDIFVPYISALYNEAITSNDFPVLSRHNSCIQKRRKMFKREL